MEALGQTTAMAGLGHAVVVVQLVPMSDVPAMQVFDLDETLVQARSTPIRARPYLHQLLKVHHNPCTRYYCSSTMFPNQASPVVC